MERPSSPLDITQAPLEIIRMILQHVSLKDRVTCALVCQAWAKAAAATHSIILQRGPQHISCLQQWLKKHGNFVEVLQLHECSGAALTALPCAHLQDLLLHGGVGYDSCMRIYRRVVGDIAAATKVTSVSLSNLSIACQKADVVAALTALQDLQQLTWRDVHCRYQPLQLPAASVLRDSASLQQLTMLTRLDLHSYIKAEALQLQHLGSLTKLQQFSIDVPKDWATAGCPGLQRLKALTMLDLYNNDDNIPACVYELTALQQLGVSAATPTAVNGLQALTRLTLLRVRELKGLSLEAVPLQLPALQHLELKGYRTAPMSFLASCTQLRVLELGGLNFMRPGSLVASTMLQHLKLGGCNFWAADGAAVSFQQGFTGPGRLPHLTLLHVARIASTKQESYMAGVVSYCSSLRVVYLEPEYWRYSFLSALARLPGLTGLHLSSIYDPHLHKSLTQLTGLRELTADNPGHLFTFGFKQIAAWKQLASLAFKRKFYHWEASDRVLAVMEDRLQGYSHAIINKAPAGSPPDVSTRLLQACYPWTYMLMGLLPGLAQHICICVT